jgi:hypothetical protein
MFFTASKPRFHLRQAIAPIPLGPAVSSTLCHRCQLNDATERLGAILAPWKRSNADESTCTGDRAHAHCVEAVRHVSRVHLSFPERRRPELLLRRSKRRKRHPRSGISALTFLALAQQGLTSRDFERRLYLMMWLRGLRVTARSRHAER